MVVLKNILVATDFSEPSAVALAYGRDLARSYNAKLHVLHIVEDVLTRYSPELAFATPDLQKELEKSARVDLAGLISDDDRKTLDVVPVVAQGVNVAAAIVDYAQTNAIDIVIVGTHGRGAMKQFLMGSAAERVVRTAPCPVLVVRAQEREFIAPDALVKVAKA